MIVVPETASNGGNGRDGRDGRDQAGSRTHSRVQAKGVLTSRLLLLLCIYS